MGDTKMPKERMILDRDDLLELTRRMNLSRNCFSRLAGAYLDEDGFVDGSFNIHFGKLSAPEKDNILHLAKKVPFAETNGKLKGFFFEKEEMRPGKLWHLLMALRDCELKNDALMDSFYEIMGENYPSDHPLAVYLYYGIYDVPVKNRNGESMWESEEVYRFLICTIASVKEDYEAGEIEAGFLFPAFLNRCSEETGIALYQEQGTHTTLQNLFK